jgi:hypothetical protein
MGPGWQQQQQRMQQQRQQQQRQQQQQQQMQRQQQLLREQMERTRKQQESLRQQQQKGYYWEQQQKKKKDKASAKVPTFQAVKGKQPGKVQPVNMQPAWSQVQKPVKEKKGGCARVFSFLITLAIIAGVIYVALLVWSNL